jgi:hypothetical protein
MENFEVTPTPINTSMDLLAKLDMILGAAQQWISEEDDALGLTIFQRLYEVSAELDVVPDNSEDWSALGEKLLEIKEAMRQKSVNELEAMYEGS